MAEDNTVVEFPQTESGKLLVEGKKKYRQLHGAIFGEISSMLCRAKLEPIDRLHGSDPSFTALVKELKDFRDIVSSLAPLFGFEKDIGMIDEYISLAEGLASSIDAQDSDALCAVIAMLDEKPYV